jgi:acid phosphatase
VCTPSQHLNSAPLTQLANDISNHATPNYAYITPNTKNDADLGKLSGADGWLAKQVPKILALPEFQSTGDGILFIVSDEGQSGDDRCSATASSGCGGRVATVVIGPKVRRGYKSKVTYHHQNLLRTVCNALAFSTCPGAGSNATPMSDMF